MMKKRAAPFACKFSKQLLKFIFGFACKELFQVINIDGNIVRISSMIFNSLTDIHLQMIPTIHDAYIWQNTADCTSYSSFSVCHDGTLRLFQVWHIIPIFSEKCFMMLHKFPLMDHKSNWYGRSLFAA